MTDLKNPKIEAVTCYLDQLSTSLKQVDALFSEEDGKLVITDVEDYLALVRLAYKTLVTGLQDCSGKEIKIELGNSITANLIESLLTGLLNGKV